MLKQLYAVSDHSIQSLKVLLLLLGLGLSAVNPPSDVRQDAR